MVNVEFATESKADIEIRVMPLRLLVQHARHSGNVRQIAIAVRKLPGYIGSRIALHANCVEPIVLVLAELIH
ncbi:hypothetical protein [Paraburkholderia hospita]|uniref:hypothetical protein n=1 Tax=Paraburkholderia hospita TaxID=169430 RepID=UPI00103F6DC0|nr:hypothetical protein [Paraburkholderia hospita]